MVLAYVVVTWIEVPVVVVAAMVVVVGMNGESFCGVGRLESCVCVSYCPSAPLWWWWWSVLQPAPSHALLPTPQTLLGQ